MLLTVNATALQVAISPLWGTAKATSLALLPTSPTLTHYLMLLSTQFISIAVIYHPMKRITTIRRSFLLRVPYTVPPTMCEMWPQTFPLIQNPFLTPLILFRPPLRLKLTTNIRTHIYCSKARGAWAMPALCSPYLLVRAPAVAVTATLESWGTSTTRTGDRAH